MAEGSYVYVIGSPTPATGPVKIGWTGQHPMVRLFNLRRPSCGEHIPTTVDRGTLAVLFECEGGWDLEQALHAHFVERRVSGEWFDLDPAQVRHLVEHAIAAMGRCKTDGCDRPRWDDSVYCRPHDLDLWLRSTLHLYPSITLRGPA